MALQSHWPHRGQDAGERLFFWLAIVSTVVVGRRLPGLHVAGAIAAPRRSGSAALSIAVRSIMEAKARCSFRHLHCPFQHGAYHSIRQIEQVHLSSFRGRWTAPRHH